MRPQHITAENLPPPVVVEPLDYASMRPQHITAENLQPVAGQGFSGGCFNEAAAYHCGKR